MYFKFENREIYVDTSQFAKELTDEEIIAFLKVLYSNKLEDILTNIKNI